MKQKNHSGKQGERTKEPVRATSGEGKEGEKEEEKEERKATGPDVSNE